VSHLHLTKDRGTVIADQYFTRGVLDLTGQNFNQRCSKGESEKDWVTESVMDDRNNKVFLVRLGGWERGRPSTMRKNNQKARDIAIVIT
jgi:alpha-D-ribose 1-methylphosphonate 5-phosphate C-P lyase